MPRATSTAQTCLLRPARLAPKQIIVSIQYSYSMMQKKQLVQTQRGKSKSSFRINCRSVDSKKGRSCLVPVVETVRGTIVCPLHDMQMGVRVNACMKIWLHLKTKHAKQTTKPWLVMHSNALQIWKSSTAVPPLALYRRPEVLDGTGNDRFCRRVGNYLLKGNQVRTAAGSPDDQCLEVQECPNKW